MQLTTEQGLSAYLTSQFIKHTSVTLLTGGTANYVYRVTFPSGATAIYKHAAPYLHSNTNFAFDPSRLDYEDHVLNVLPSLLERQLPSSDVHVVGCNSYDRERKLLCIEDGGERELKKAYTDLSLDVKKIGEELGTWIAAVHMCSPQTSLSLSDGKDLAANNPIALSVYGYSYKNLEATFSDYAHDVDFAKRINEEFGAKLTTDNECICHGDFWPGNVLVKFKGEDESDVALTIVDWEISRRGISATDVAQFSAEAFLLDRFRGGRGLLPAFLNAYFTAREDDTAENRTMLGREWIRRMAVHGAVHIAFWPTVVEWADREETEKLVDIGVSILMAVVEDDWEKLSASVLFKDLDERFRNVWQRP